ncbi:MFS transporter [Myroides albus]|uniref:MFS transporter n=1 Tax=Myroides albus TaxID=2562892 RepID=A0A6I3LI74_9FLAO|nr:MFS transporter [Myroides albus]MTG97276.1 MFS transporter [Myroides albus]UVD80637.1 MFS transporter [Myroides albus]
MLKNTSEQRKKLITALAFISIPLSGFVTDIYLPSFPSMAKDLNVLEKEIQLTLTCYLLSYGISQLFVGSLLDSIGRYKPRLIALFTLVITSISIAYLDNIFYICLLRIVQGIGISILVVATRALFMDLYDTEKRAHYLSYFTVVWSCGPILAPFLGGYLEKLFNWQANFFFLAIYAGILLILDLAISGESIPEKKKFNLKNTVQLYSTMLQNKMFMLGIIILGLSYSIVMIFNIAGPFIIENTFHYNSVVIGYCTLILGFSWMLGGFVGKRRIYLEFEPRVKQPAIVQLILIGGLIAMSYFLENIWVMMPFLFLIHICSGTLFNNFFTSTMLTFPENSGTAGGLMGGLVYVITSISSFVISSTGNISGQMELSIRYIIISLLLFSTILLIVQANKKLLK